MRIPDKVQLVARGQRREDVVANFETIDAAVVVGDVLVMIHHQYHPSFRINFSVHGSSASINRAAHSVVISSHASRGI